MTLLRKGAPQSGVMPWGWGAAQLQVNQWLARQGFCRASPTHTCLGLKACTCPSREKREGRSLALLPTPEAKSPLGDPTPSLTSTPGQETASTPTGHLRLGCQQRPEMEALGLTQSSCPPQPSCPFTNGDLDSPGLQQPCSRAPGIVRLSRDQPPRLQALPHCCQAACGLGDGWSEVAGVDTGPGLTECRSRTQSSQPLKPASTILALRRGQSGRGARPWGELVTTKGWLLGMHSARFSSAYMKMGRAAGEPPPPAKDSLA